MPLFDISINNQDTKVPDDFFSTATAKIAEALKKPEKFVAVRLRTGERMSWGGTFEPCAMVNINNIGSVNTDDATAILGPFICETFGIPKDRYYITYSIYSYENVGHQHTSFKTWKEAQAKSK